MALTRHGGDRVRAVDRALRLLEIIADEPTGLRLHEVAARASLPASTCHRLLGVMQDRRFVQYDHTLSVWHVGRQAFRVGAAFVRRKTFIVPALPTMRRLRDDARETVNIAVPDDGCVIILALVESREVVRAINLIGGRAPMSASALGKAILASYGDAALERHVERHGLPGRTPYSLTSVDDLRGELEAVRTLGFAIDREEYLPGLRCVAAPIFDAAGDAVASLSVSGLAGRLEDMRIDRIGETVAHAAAELSDEQGGKAPNTWRMVS